MTSCDYFGAILLCQDCLDCFSPSTECGDGYNGDALDRYYDFQSIYECDTCMWLQNNVSDGYPEYYSRNWVQKLLANCFTGRPGLYTLCTWHSAAILLASSTVAIDGFVLQWLDWLLNKCIRKKVPCAIFHHGLGVPYQSGGGSGHSVGERRNLAKHRQRRTPPANGNLRAKRVGGEKR